MYNPKEVRMRAIICKITQTPDNLQTNKKKKKILCNLRKVFAVYIITSHNLLDMGGI